MGTYMADPYRLYAQQRVVRGDAALAAEDPSLFAAPENWFAKKNWNEHTAAFLIPKRKYYDEHPEYFALQGNGERLPKETPDWRMHVCPTHPDVLRISTERTLMWISKQPDRKLFNISQADDHEWCVCKRCLDMEYEPGNVSDRMLYWTNHIARAVAKKYPDKILITYAYGPTQPPPVKLKPEPNVHVLYAAWPNETSAPNSEADFDHPRNALALSEIRGWLKVAPNNVGLYTYPSFGGYTINATAWRVKWCARNGLRSIHFCGNQKTFNALHHYVQSRLTWNPFLEVATLRRNFTRAYYGPKAGPIVDEIVREIHDQAELGAADDQRVPFVKEMLALFDKAMASISEEEQKRFHYDDVEKARKFFYRLWYYRFQPRGRKEIPGDEMAFFCEEFPKWISNWLKKHEENIATATKEGKKPPGYQSLVDGIWEQAHVKVDINEFKDGKLPSIVNRLMTKPAEELATSRITEFSEKLPDGWRLPGNAFTGGRLFRSYSWKCEKRNNCIAINGTRTRYSRMRAEWTIESEPPAGIGVVELEGQSDDKLFTKNVRIKVLLNNKRLFEGVSPFPKRGWSKLKLPLPEGLLHKGVNVMEIRNLNDSDQLYLNWCMISEAKLTFPP
ncbi:MAG: DUF4838 domain-containing protein [Planctomycetota bacterium]|nr:DUF4838 domain-containing protein [Planctomycetota bacterium]